MDTSNISKFVDVQPWDCSDEEYFEGECVGSSGIKRALGYDGPTSYDGDFGNASHIAIAQPDIFFDRVITPPPECCRGSGKGQQERLAAWEAEHAEGKIVLNAKDFAAAKTIRDSVVGRAAIRRHLARKEIAFERSFRAVDDATGIDIRIRPDVMSPRTLDDIKTAASPAFGAFMRAIGANGYFVQAALYVDVLAPFLGQEPRFWWLVVGKSPPHRVGLYRCTEEWIELGRRYVRSGLDIIAHARDAGVPIEAWWENRPLEADPPPPWLRDDATLHEMHATRMRGAA